MHKHYAHTYVITEAELRKMPRRDLHHLFSTGRLSNALGTMAETLDNMAVSLTTENVEQFGVYLVRTIGLYKAAMDHCYCLGGVHETEDCFSGFWFLLNTAQGNIDQAIGNPVIAFSATADEGIPIAPYRLVSYERELRKQIESVSDVAGTKLVQGTASAGLSEPAWLCKDLSEETRLEIYREVCEVTIQMIRRWRRCADMFMTGMSKKLGLETYRNAENVIVHPDGTIATNVKATVETS